MICVKIKLKNYTLTSVFCYERAVGYAFIANAASFALGLWLAHIIPGIF